MIRLLAFLWSGCWHEWEVVKTVNVFNKPDDGFPYAQIYIMRCKKCGEMKSKEL